MKLEKEIIKAANKSLSQIEISFCALIVSYDKKAMTAEISPLLKTVTRSSVDGDKTERQSQNIKGVRVDREPGIRPIYEPGDVVKCVTFASPIDDPIENQRPVDMLGHRFNLNQCTIKGVLRKRTFTAPSHYDSEDGLIINDDPNQYISFRDSEVYLKGKHVIDGTLEVNGNSRSLVTHTELQNELTLMLIKINTALAAKLDGGGSPGTVTVDISLSKTDNIKTGAG